jgi:hypothetical protein
VKKYKEGSQIDRPSIMEDIRMDPFLNHMHKKVGDFDKYLDLQVIAR